jgi:cleavage stimulation factor subunit 1
VASDARCAAHASRLLRVRVHRRCAGAASEVKLWDGGSIACIATLGRAHGGSPVGSVLFSRDGRYLLTAGADSAVKLWDVRALRASGAAAARAAPTPLRTYEGGGQASARRVACFSHDERHVISADEPSASAVVWLRGAEGTDAPPGGELVAKCAGHARPVRCIAPAPNAPVFVTCADDGKLRAWAQ